MECLRRACPAAPITLALLLAAAPPAAAATFRAHPDFDAARLAAIRTVGLLGFDVKVYQVSAGGVREPKDDWTQAAAANLRAALAEGLTARGITVADVPAAPETAEEVAEVRALYEVVGGTIVAFTYVQPIPHKVARFEYSVGEVGDLLDRHGLDALLFVTASDEISSAGRKTTAAVAAVVGAFLGVVPVAQGGRTMLSAALVDRSGAVLWFSIRGGAGAFDLRDAGSAATLVDRLLRDLPEPVR